MRDYAMEQREKLDARVRDLRAEGVDVVARRERDFALAQRDEARDERDEARADAARWKAEAERLREDVKHALMVADETASMQCECDGYYRCGSCPTRIANRAEDVAEILQRSLDNDWGSALSAGGGTDGDA